MRAPLALAFCTALTGCGVLDAPGDILALKSRMEFLEKENSRISTSLIELQKKQQTPLFRRDIAYLDPAGDTSYQYLETNVSPLLVSYVGAAPVGDGVRITLKLGNMTAATFSGAELKISYGPRAPKGDDIKLSELSEWDGKVRTTDAKIVTHLSPGSWNTVTAALPEIKPEQLGYLSVQAKLDVVALR